MFRSEFGAVKCPTQENAYVLGHCPFYTPWPVDDHLSLLRFKNLPLPGSLIEALLDHPELSLNDLLIRWTQERDLIFQETLGR